MKIYLYLLLATTLLVVSCKSDDNLEDEKQVHNTEYDQDEDNTTQEINDSYVYKLPVIFHVIYNNRTNSKQYVSQSRLATILSRVNELYKGNIYGKSENINVEFQLATNDEKGNKLTSPGVEYIEWDEDYPINPYKIMGSKGRAYTKYIWDPNEYINIMVYNFATDEDTDGITLGISHMPYVTKNGSALAGLNVVNQTTLSKENLGYAYCSSINSLYIDEESTRYDADKGKNSYNYNSSDVIVTLAHELGHYLGLHHTFTQRTQDQSYEMVDSCGDTDFCKDTPSYNRIAYQRELKNYLTYSKDDIDIRYLLRRSNCNGSDFYSENLMDYSISYSFSFSPEQKQRIRKVLYYSPLIPGPKLQPGTNRRLVTTKGTGKETGKVLDLPIVFVK